MNVIESLLYKIDLVDLVGKFTELHQDSNGVFRGRCPIHHGDNPTSLSVFPNGSYYCFSCHSFGNAIQFYSEVTGYAFYQAVEKLCEEYEVSTSDEMYVKQKDIVGANTKLASRFHKQVWNLEEYLTTRRGFTKEVIDEFNLGYDTGGFMSDVPGLMIPIQDMYGRIVGFSKRRLDDGKPKYKNTSDDDIFKKGSILYNYHRAIKLVKKHNCLHVVEGYLDVISAHQQGVPCVGYLSSKVTKQQIIILKELQERFPDVTIVLSTDNPQVDEAGRKMLPRIRDSFMKYAPNINVRCVVFPKEGE